MRVESGCGRSLLAQDRASLRLVGLVVNGIRRWYRLLLLRVLHVGDELVRVGLVGIVLRGLRGHEDSLWVKPGLHGGDGVHPGLGALRDELRIWNKKRTLIYFKKVKHFRITNNLTKF